MAGARTVWLLLVAVVQVKFNAGQSKRQRSWTFEEAFEVRVKSLSAASPHPSSSGNATQQAQWRECGFATLET